MRVVFVGRNRVPWRCQVLYIVTFGIWRRLWLYRVSREIDGHDALGTNHRLEAALLCLPIVGPSIVAARVATRARAMLTGSPVAFGHGGAVYLATWVPIVGNLFYIGWVQSRLNRFWAHESAHPEHGVDIDLKLDDDPLFVAELGAAVRPSYFPGSRFDRKRDERRAALQRRAQAWDEVRRERSAVRSAGGSTPVLPWRRLNLPPTRMLHITCGRCEAKFDVTQDPFQDTPILCPKCGLNEVMPSLHSDPLQRPDQGAIATLRIDCPQCKVRFSTVRNLHGPTPIVCPSCGRKDVMHARIDSALSR